MAGAMRKMAVYLGLVEDDDLRYDDELYDEVDTDERDDARRGYSDPSGRRGLTTVSGGGAGAAATAGSTALATRPVPRPSRPVAEPPARQASVSGLPGVGSVEIGGGVDAYRITTLHPRNYNDARTVGEYYREGTPVIMNLTDMEDADAKRLVDFAAGLVFGLHGTIERVTAKVFLLSPANVVVTAEEKARLAEGGFFNQS